MPDREGSKGNMIFLLIVQGGIRSGKFDPPVRFDRESDRYLSILLFNEPGPTSNLLFAVVRSPVVIGEVLLYMMYFCPLVTSSQVRKTWPERKKPDIFVGTALKTVTVNRILANTKYWIMVSPF